MSLARTKKWIFLNRLREHKSGSQIARYFAQPLVKCVNRNTHRGIEASSGSFATQMLLQTLDSAANPASLSPSAAQFHD